LLKPHFAARSKIQLDQYQALSVTRQCPLPDVCEISTAELTWLFKVTFYALESGVLPHFQKEYRTMKTDAELKADVIAELAWDSAINPTGIGVMVTNGVVTLTGHLETFTEKHAVERAVRRVAGVRGIALELDVKVSAAHKRSDSEIAQAAATALLWNSNVPDDRVQIEVENGWITLTGELDWHYQLTSAEQCISSLLGVRGLTNNITIKPRVNPKQIGAEIISALTRQAVREAEHIGIEVSDGVVTLKGKVHSLAERDAAVGAAYTARGVSQVIDKIEVGL
jgi:osmotically-inducible protein OsmY